MTTPLKIIRLKCLDCCGGSPQEIRQCVVIDCSLWSYRLGVRPSTLMKNKEKKALLRADLIAKTVNMTSRQAEKFIDETLAGEGYYDA